MTDRKWLNSLTALIAMILIPAATWAGGGPRGPGAFGGPATLGGALVKCGSVTNPAALSTCSTTPDPLTQGMATNRQSRRRRGGGRGRRGERDLRGRFPLS